MPPSSEQIGRLQTLGPALTQSGESAAQMKKDLQVLRSQIEGLDGDEEQKKPILEQIEQLIQSADTMDRSLTNAGEVTGFGGGGRKAALSDGGVTIPGADGGRDTLVQGIHGDTIVTSRHDTLTGDSLKDRTYTEQDMALPGVGNDDPLIHRPERGVFNPERLPDGETMPPRGPLGVPPRI